MAEGIVIIDKAADWTSMDVCAKLRYRSCGAFSTLAVRVVNIPQRAE